MLRTLIGLASLALLAGNAAGAKSICLSGHWDFLPLRQDRAVERSGDWTWDRGQMFEGVPAHVSAPQPLERHALRYAAPVLIGASATFYQPVLLDPLSPPDAVAIRFHVFHTDSWTATILFSEPGRTLPAELEADAVTTALPLPRPGHWWVLEMPTDGQSAGLAGRYVDGIEFIAVNGRVHWGATSFRDDAFGARPPTAFPVAEGASVDAEGASWLPNRIPVPGAWCEPDPELGGFTAPYATHSLLAEFKRVDEALLRRTFDATPLLYGLNPEVGLRLRFAGGVNHHGAYRINDSPWFALDLPLTPHRGGDIRPWVRQGDNEVVVRLRRCPRDVAGNPLEPAGGVWAMVTGGIPGDVYLEEIEPLTTEDIRVDADWDRRVCEVTLRAPQIALTGQEWSPEEFANPRTRLAAMKRRQLTASSALQGGQVTLELVSGTTPLSETWSGDLPAGDRVVKARLNVLTNAAASITPWTPGNPTTQGLVVSVNPSRGASYRFVRPFAFPGVRIDKGRVLVGANPLRLMADEWQFLGPGFVNADSAQAGYRVLKDLGANTVIYRGLPMADAFAEKALNEGAFLILDPNAGQTAPGDVFTHVQSQVAEDYAWRHSGNPAVLEVLGAGRTALGFQRVFEGFAAFTPFDARVYRGEEAVGRPPSYYEALGEHLAARLFESRHASNANLLVSPLVSAAVRPVPDKESAPTVPGVEEPGWRPSSIPSHSLPLPPGYGIVTSNAKRAGVYDVLQSALAPLKVRIEDPPRSLWSEEETARTLTVVGDLPEPMEVTLTLAVRGRDGKAVNVSEKRVLEPGASTQVTLRFRAPRAFDMQQLALEATAEVPGLLNPRVPRYRSTDSQMLNVIPVTFRQQILTRSRTRPAFFGSDEASRLVVSRWFPSIAEVRATPDDFLKYNLIFVLSGAITPSNGEAVKTAVTAALQGGRRVVLLPQRHLPPDFPWKGAELVDAAPQITSSAEHHVFLHGVDLGRLNVQSLRTNGYLDKAYRLPESGYYLSFLDARRAGAAGSGASHPDLTAALRVAVWPGTLYLYQLPVTDAEPDALQILSRYCLEARDEILWSTQKPRTLVLSRDRRSASLLSALDWQYETLEASSPVASIPRRQSLLFLDAAYAPDAGEQEWLREFITTGRRVFINAAGSEPAGFPWLPQGMEIRPLAMGSPLPTRYGLTSLTEGLLLDDVYRTGARRGFSLIEDGNPPLLVTHQGWSAGWQDPVSDFVRPMALERSFREQWGILGLLTYIPWDNGGLIVSTLDFRLERLQEPPVRRALSMLLSNAEAVWTGFADRLVQPPAMPGQPGPVAQGR